MNERFTLITKPLIMAFLLFVITTSHPASGTSDKPLTLTKVGQIDTHGDAYDVWVDADKDIAYVTCGYQGALILDVSNKTSPVELARVRSSFIAEHGWDGYAHQFSMHEDMMYVGDGIGGLKIINCSDPANPEVITQFVDGYAWSARIVGNTAFIGHGYFDINGKLTAVNITDPSNPVILKNCSTMGAASDVEVSGNLAFVATSYAGFTVFDISNQSNPVEVGKWNGSSNNALESGNLEIVGDLVYLSYWQQGFKVLNVSDLENIEVVNEFNEYQGLFSVHVERDRNLAFLSDTELGLIVVDTSDLTQPVELTRYSDGGKPCMVHVVGDLVYMTDQENGLIILEIGESDTSTTVEDGSTTPGFELSLVILGVVSVFARRKKKVG